MEQTKDAFLNRISIAECRKLLKDESLTDEQVLTIRDFLYIVAEIDYKYHEQINKPQTIIIPLNVTNYDEEKSHSLRPGEYRRAS